MGVRLIILRGMFWKAARIFVSGWKATSKKQIAHSSLIGRTSLPFRDSSTSLEWTDAALIVFQHAHSSLMGRTNFAVQRQQHKSGMDKCCFDFSSTYCI